jgi:hypothetical protein
MQSCFHRNPTSASHALVSDLNGAIPALDLYLDLGAEGARAILGGSDASKLFLKHGLDNIPRPYSKVAEELFFFKVDGLRRSFSFLL